MSGHGGLISARPLQLAAAGELARLTYYPPRLRQPPHSHERAHVSIIVTGSIRETAAGREQVGFPPALTVRPYDVTHAGGIFEGVEELGAYLHLPASDLRSSRAHAG